MFRILDDNKNRQLEAAELENGLRDFGINMNDEQVAAILKYFDKDGSKTVNFDEFLTAIRGELNDFRLEFVRQAYNKLDKNGDGTVTLDDIAKIYDVSQHPDVVNGDDPKEVYQKFMSQWDT